MKLFGSLTSPFTRKVRLVILEKKIDCEFIVDHNQLPDYQATKLNPLSKVPVLQLDETIVVFDSPVIAEYLDNLTPNKKLIPSPSRERMIVKRWEALGDGICEAAIAIVMEKRRAPAMQDINAIAHQKIKVERGIAFCAQELNNHEYCFGNHISLADLVLITTLDYVLLRLPEVDWKTQYPDLMQFWKRMSALPSVVETQPPTS